MTQAQRRQVVTGLATLVLGTAILAAAAAAKGYVVPRTEFDTHIQADTSWKREQRDLALDILCSAKMEPTHRRCK